MPRYLIVGAGAVGQPLAWHLAAGGATVAFLVKDKYAAELRAGPLTLKWLSVIPFRGSSRVEFRNYHVFTTVADAKKQEWDAVILTVASTALRQGAWLQELVDQLIKPKPLTALVFLTSAMSDLPLLEQCGVPKTQLVQGGITFIAWQAPLPGERFAPVAAARAQAPAAIGYVLPSFVLSGPDGCTKPLAKVMSDGKMPCGIVANVEAEMAFAEATLMPILVTLETSNWSFNGMRKSGQLSITAGAVRECLGVVQWEVGANKLWRLISMLLMHNWLLWLLLIVAPWVMPFDIEAYLKYHFCKVGDQTRQYIDTFVDHGRQLGSQMPKLTTIRGANPRWKPEAPELRHRAQPPS